MAPYLLKAMRNDKRSIPTTFVKFRTEDTTRKTLTIELLVEIYFRSKYDNKIWIGKYDWKEKFALEEKYEEGEDHFFLLEMTDNFELALKKSYSQYLTFDAPKNQQKSLKLTCSLNGKLKTSKTATFSTGYNRDWTELLNRAIFVWRCDISYKNFENYTFDEKTSKFVEIKQKKDKKRKKNNKDYRSKTEDNEKEYRYNTKRPYKKRIKIETDKIESKQPKSKRSTLVLLNDEEKKNSNYYAKRTFQQTE